MGENTRRWMKLEDHRCRLDDRETTNAVDVTSITSKSPVWASSSLTDHWDCDQIHCRDVLDRWNSIDHRGLPISSLNFHQHSTADMSIEYRAMSSKIFSSMIGEISWQNSDYSIFQRSRLVSSLLEPRHRLLLFNIKMNIFRVVQRVELSREKNVCCVVFGLYCRCSKEFRIRRSVETGQVRTTWSAMDLLWKSVADTMKVIVGFSLCCFSFGNPSWLWECLENVVLLWIRSKHRWIDHLASSDVCARRANWTSLEMITGWFFEHPNIDRISLKEENDHHLQQWKHASIDPLRMRFVMNWDFEWNTCRGRKERRIVCDQWSFQSISFLTGGFIFQLERFANIDSLHHRWLSFSLSPRCSSWGWERIWVRLLSKVERSHERWRWSWNRMSMEWNH